MEQVGVYPSTVSPRLRESAADDVELSRRRALADFIKARREAVTPDDVGLGRTRRRRVKGLRREEVAEAAGISVAWYTWIEQAREMRLSAATLERLSKALRLSGQEREHLYQLAGHPAPLSEEIAGEQGSVLDGVRAVLASMDPNPSYALDTRWNLLAWNDGAKSLFGDFGLVPEGQRNFVRMVFADTRFRGLYANWVDVARCTLAHFRSDSVAHVGDPQWLAMVEGLCAGSEEFRHWWSCHDVTWPHQWRKELLHPVLGWQRYTSFDFEMYRPARLRMVTYMPLGSVER